MDDNNVMNSHLFVVLSGLKKRKDRLQKEYQDRLAEIDVQIEAVNITLRLLSAQENKSLDTLNPVFIPAATFAKKTLREALQEIAKRNEGVLKVSIARKLLVEAGKIKNTKSAWAMIYTTLSRSPEFNKTAPGEFRFEPDNSHTPNLIAP